MRNIIYLVMDNQQYVKECIASINSFLRMLNQEQEQVRIVIYTNMAKQFVCFNGDPIILVKEIDDETKTIWLGSHRYIYRLKIRALIDFVETYHETAILIDTDTFFIADAGLLFKKIESKKVALMDYIENRLKDIINPQQGSCKRKNISKFFYEIYYRGKIAAGRNEYLFAEDMQLWNSGIVGVHHSHLEYLYEALELNDYMLDHYQLRTTEQVALSCVLQYRCGIESSDDAVFHYWFMKEARYLVEAALGLPVDYEAKHLSSPVIEMMDHLSRIVDYESLADHITQLVKTTKRQKLQGLFDIIPPECYFGKRLRE